MIATSCRKVLQNVSHLDSTKVPTVRITDDDIRWKEVYYNWISNRNPTDSPEWKSGMFLHFEPIYETNKQKTIPISELLESSIMIKPKTIKDAVKDYFGLLFLSIVMFSAFIYDIYR